MTVGTVLVGLLLTAACQRADAGPVVLPTGSGHLVAASRLVGGFVPPGWHEIETAQIAVYSDGTAIAEAQQRLTLTPAEVVDLVVALRRDLSGLGPTVEPRGGVQVADASTTVLQVLGADGQVRSVHAYALGLIGGYPKGLVAAQNRLAQLAQRVTRDGDPYTADRVRLVAQERGDGDTAGTWTAGTWPAEVPVPEANPLGVRVADLSGAPAAAIVATVRDVKPGDPWPALRTGDGLTLAVIWRYLLPDE